MAIEQEKIIERIQKLLAFTTENATQEEAATAAAKVQELLQKYNLDRSTLASSSGQKSNLIMVDIQLPSSRLWAKRLFHALASFNFCQALWVHGKDRGILIGEKTNTEAVATLFNSLSETLLLMATSAYARYCSNCRLVRPLSAQSYKTNFYTGAIDVIINRLFEQQEEFAAKSNQCRSLIVVNEQAIKDFVQEQFPQTKIVKDVRSRSSLGTQGYQAGVNAGHSVELNKLVN